MGKWAKSESIEDSNPGTVEIRAVYNTVLIVKLWEWCSTVQHIVVQWSAALYSAT